MIRAARRRTKSDGFAALRAFGFGSTAASRAACCGVSRAGSTRKYAAAAALTPNTPSPNSATFR